MKNVRLNDLLEEMQVALRDEFVAEIAQEEGGLLMKFSDGQTFRVTVEEVVDQA